MNYLDLLAAEIQRMAEPDSTPPDEYLPLYRQYAVLALVKGEQVTVKDVHDAWACWASDYDPTHRHLIPFKELSLPEQRRDEPYAEAIRKTVSLWVQKEQEGVGPDVT